MERRRALTIAAATAMTLSAGSLAFAANLGLLAHAQNEPVGKLNATNVAELLDPEKGTKTPSVPDAPAADATGASAEPGLATSPVGAGAPVDPGVFDPGVAPAAPATPVDGPVGPAAANPAYPAYPAYPANPTIDPAWPAPPAAAGPSGPAAPAADRDPIGDTTADGPTRPDPAAPIVTTTEPRDEAEHAEPEDDEAEHEDPEHEDPEHEDAPTEPEDDHDD